MDREKVFLAVFGLEPSQIREVVVFSPIIYPKPFEKDYGQEGEHVKCKLGYLVANFPHLTFIKTPQTQSAVSDAVLLLEGTACKQLIFIGAIGGLDDKLNIGDIFTTKDVQKVHSVKSIHEETKKSMIILGRQDTKGIDYESAGFFSAAIKINVPAVAHYVVSDLPLTRPFYEEKTPEEEARIKGSVTKIIKQLSGS